MEVDDNPQDMYVYSILLFKNKIIYIFGYKFTLKIRANIRGCQINGKICKIR